MIFNRILPNLYRPTLWLERIVPKIIIAVVVDCRRIGYSARNVTSAWS